MQFALVFTTTQGIKARVASGLRYADGRCEIVFRHCKGVWSYESLDAVKQEHCSEKVSLVY